MSVFPLLAAVTSCLLLLNVTASPSSCPISISTLEHVTICPKSEREWDERAKEKGCETLAQYQKCTSVETFSYHCIFNADATRLVEVCAPKWFMTGYCARFSKQEKRIINDPGLDCTKFVPPCPLRYNSTEAHKYQNCYAEVERTLTVNGHVSSASSSPIVWILTILSCGLVIALIIISALYIRGRRKESKVKNVEELLLESYPLSPKIQDEAAKPSSDAAKETNREKQKKEAKPEKMQIKTLPGRESVECEVKEVQSVAELKGVVTEPLNSSKELIEIVDQRTVPPNADAFFHFFLDHEVDINAIERPKIPESHYQDVYEICEVDET